MRAVLALALLATACRIDLDHASPDANTSGRSCPIGTVSLCVQATPTYSWIKANIFGRNCATSSCHDTAMSGGKLDLNSSAGYTALVGSGSGGVPSIVDPSRTLVVPGNPAKSYLLVMTRSIEADQADPPATPPNQLRDSNNNLIGYMPQNGTILCCQKLDALTTWIQQGALNN